MAEAPVEAAATPDARPWARAVYDGADPVGFVPISDGITVDRPDHLGPYFPWRLLIDRGHQGRGYGAAAVRLVLRHVRTRPDARVLPTSRVPGPAPPRGCYRRLGFPDTGRVPDGELVLELDLR